MIEETHAGLRVNVLPARIDQVDIGPLLHVGGLDHAAEAGHAVFGLVGDLHPFRNEARAKRGDTDTQVHHRAIEELPGYAHGDRFTAQTFFAAHFLKFSFLHLEVALDVARETQVLGYLDDALHKKARHHDRVGIDFARLDDLVYFGDRCFGRGRHDRIELSLGAAEDQIAQGV